MSEQKNEFSIVNSKGSLDKFEINKYINNNKLGIKINNIIMNYLYLILFIIRIIILIIFIFLFINKSKNGNICEYGYFIPEDDQTKCIKCSIEGCMECYGNKLNNICNKCYLGLNTFYKNDRIISCSVCEKGYYFIDGECINYSFKAIYKSDGSETRLINYRIDDIKEMIVDGKNVTPNNTYSFNDTLNHEIFMLLDSSNITSMSFMFSECISLFQLIFLILILQM